MDAIQELNQLFHLVTELGLGCTALTCLLCLPVSRSTFLLHQVHRTLLLYFPAVPSSILLCNTLCVVLTCFFCNTLLCPIMWSVAFYFFPQMLQFCVVHPRLPFCFVNVACCAFAAHRSDWPVVAFPAVARQTSAQPLTSTSSSASSTTSTSSTSFNYFVVYFTMSRSLTDAVKAGNIAEVIDQWSSQDGKLWFLGRDPAEHGRGCGSAWTAAILEVSLHNSPYFQSFFSLYGVYYHWSILYLIQFVLF